MSDKLPRDTHVCCHPRVMADVLDGWPEKRMTYRVNIALPGITPAEVADTVAWAVAQWSAAAGIAISEAKPGEPANLTCRDRQLTDAGFTSDQILALTEIPEGVPQDFQLTMIVNTNEAWDLDLFRVVFLHEFGHGLGLGHLQSSSAIMFWLADKSESGRGLSPDDADALLGLYGPPAAPIPGAAPADVEFDILAPAPGWYLIKCSGPAGCTHSVSGPTALPPTRG